MSNNSKMSFNQMIWVLVAPLYVFMVLGVVRPFIGSDILFSQYTPSLDFENHHYLGPWIFIYFAGYILLFLNRNNENIFLITKIVVSVSAAIALMDPITREYGFSYFLMILFLAGSGVFTLYWKTAKREKVDLGPYPLMLDRYTGFPTSSLHENCQIVGGTGTGKTHYVIKPFIEQTIKQGLGCFIYDVKANMLRDVAFYCMPKRFIYHFNLANPFASHSYNPLYGDNADAIANRVFTALYYDTKGTEPYYVELADAFLHNLVGLLKKEIKTITFQDLLTATQEADTFRTISWFCAKHPETHYARYFRDLWMGKSPKDRRTELSGLINKLQRFCNSDWAYLLNVREPNIRMAEVVSQGEILLFSPDSARYPEDAKRLSILAMMDMAEQLADRYNPNMEKKPFRVFLDEFYNLAYPRFIDFINKCREAQVNLFLAHQSLGDLRGVSNEFLEQVMNTASNKIILRVNDPDTAESFARQFGTEQDVEYKVESFGSDGKMMGYSKPQVEKFRFHPNLIKELRVGEAVVKVVGRDGVDIFETSLSPASQPWNDYNPKTNLKYKPKEDFKKEISLSDLMPDPDGPKKPGKGQGNGNGMGDEDAA
jgi:type IV secretory pathway TraG/TraD family ATPase VirD4